MGKRMSQSEKIAIAVRAALQAQANGTDPVVAALESVQPVESKIDRAAIQAKIDTFLANAKMPLTDQVFVTLGKIDGQVKAASIEQELVIAHLYETLTAEEKALCKISAAMTIGTLENGNRTTYDRLGVVVPERKPIVHPEGWERPSGVALDAKFDQTKLTARQSTWVKAIIAGGTGKDNLYHNAQYKAAYLTAFGEERNTNFDLVGELPCMVKVYSAKEKAA